MRPESELILVVDDDPAVRRSLQWLLESVAYKVHAFASAAELLAFPELRRGVCLITDLRMPGLSGLELHQTLQQRGVEVPTIVITGHGDVPAAVRALKAGVVDFIQKPFNDQQLLDTVARTIEHFARRREERATVVELRRRLATLSPREHEVFDGVVAGLANKAIAVQLGISEKTVETHRGSIMRKMEAESLAALVRMAVALENELKSVREGTSGAAAAVAATAPRTVSTAPH